jgi:hypothetical protein
MVISIKNEFDKRLLAFGQRLADEGHSVFEYCREWKLQKGVDGIAELTVVIPLDAKIVDELLGVSNVDSR